MLTATVKIDQSEGIPDSGIPERVIVKKFYRRSFRPLFPIPPLFFLAFFRVALPVLSRRCYYLNAWNRLPALPQLTQLLVLFHAIQEALLNLLEGNVQMPPFVILWVKGQSKVAFLPTILGDHESPARFVVRNLEDVKCPTAK